MIETDQWRLLKASAWSLMTDTGKKLMSRAFKYLVKPAAKTGLHMYGKPALLPSH